MNHTELYNHIESLLDEVKNILLTKNAAYSSNDDALANFKEGGKLLNHTPFETWGTYFWKQLSALYKAIEENPEYPMDKSEGTKSRIIDAIAYLCLFYGLWMEPTELFKSNKE